MKTVLSDELINFFLDVEISKKTNTNNNNSVIEQEFSSNTNEFNLRVFIRYKNNLQRTNINKHISEVLALAEHPDSQEIIDGIILLFSLSTKEMRNASLVNIFFSLIRKCKLKQYLFFNGQQAEKIHTLKLKDFYIGNIDYMKFTDFIKHHSTSDFGDRYKSLLFNKAGIEIKNYEIKILDIYGWGAIINNGNFDLEWEQKEIINLYLEAISKFYFNEFKSKFYKQQEFINSYFGLHYPIEEIELFGYMFVNIFYNFLNNSNAGWVLPTSVQLSNVYFPDPRIIEKVNSFLSKNGDSIYQAQGEFSRYLDAICNIFSNAEKHILRKNYNNAFVDFFVGLDFLLAPDTEKSKKLKQRISLLVLRGCHFPLLSNWPGWIVCMMSEVHTYTRGKTLTSLI